MSEKATTHVTCNRATRDAVLDEIAYRGIANSHEFPLHHWQQDESLEDGDVFYLDAAGKIARKASFPKRKWHRWS